MKINLKKKESPYVTVCKIVSYINLNNIQKPINNILLKQIKEEIDNDLFKAEYLL